MKQNDETAELNEAICLLEKKRAVELKLMKEQLHIVHESLKPVNLFKNIVKEVTDSPSIKNNIVNNTIGLVTGYLTKNAIFGVTRNPVSKLFGTLFQFAITNVVSKNSDGIKTKGESLINRIMNYRKEPKSEFQHNGRE